MKLLQRVALVSLLFLSGSESNFAATLALEWDPSPDPAVVGYHLYYGAASQQYTNFVAVGLNTTATLSDLVDGVVYYLAATTLDATGVESDFSSEVIYQPAPASPGLILFSNLDQVYDGALKPVAVTTAPPGLAVQVTYNGLPDPPTEAGTYEVAAAVTDPSYAGRATNTLVVEQATAGILLKDLDQTFSGTPKQVWAMTSPPGLALILTYNGGADWPISAGVYQVNATVDDPDYAGSSNVALVVHPAEVPIQLANLNQIYDGTPKAVSASSALASAHVRITYDGQPNPPTTAGTYQVSATLIDVNDYFGNAMATLSITKAPATVQLTNLYQIYDGTLKSVIATTIPPGLDVLLSYNGKNQTPSGVGIYDVTATVDDLNYSGSTNASLTISNGTPGIFPRNPNQPPAPDVTSTVTLRPTPARPGLILSWPAAITSVTVWQSGDLSTWTPFTNMFGAASSLFLVPQSAPCFFRATSIGPDGTNPLPLIIRKP